MADLFRQSSRVPSARKWFELLWELFVPPLLCFFFLSSVACNTLQSRRVCFLLGVNRAGQMLVCLWHTGGHGHCSQQLTAENKPFDFLTFAWSACNQTSEEFAGWSPTWSLDLISLGHVATEPHAHKQTLSVAHTSHKDHGEVIKGASVGLNVRQTLNRKDRLL